MTDPAREARFWDRHAARYAKSAISDTESYERKLRETAALMRPDTQVLEIGCGTGTTALHHAPRVAHIHATDISEAMLDIAREKARQAGVENITFTRARAGDIPAEWGQFDIVMAHSILHLVPDHRETIRNLASRLKSGGHLVSSTMCMADGMGWFRVVSGPAQLLGLFPPFAYLSHDGLVDAIKAAGLRIVADWTPGPRKAVFIIARKP